MHNVTQTLPASIAPFARIRRLFGGFVTVIDDLQALLSAADEFKRLDRLSDAQLAARGLSRSDLVQHAFRPYFAR
ncbi:MAG TPA: hypothetical protein VFR34_03625 [Paracoccaceae bacterium]|nr:hypothetical protein [Paracoccaceae bacterium]